MSTNKDISKEIQKGDLVSVPIGPNYVKGVVENVNKDTIQIDSIGSGKIDVANNKQVYKMFPGQRFDIRELNKVDTSNENGMTVVQKIDQLMAKTSVGNFKNMSNGDKVALLTGKMTNTAYDSQSLVENKQTGRQEIKDYTFKLKLNKGKDGNLKLEPSFKRQNLDLNVYGETLTKDEADRAIKKNETLILNRTSKGGIKFKTFARFDKDLNRIVAIPHDNKIEERIVKSQKEKAKVSAGATDKAQKVDKPKAQKPKGRKL